MFDCSEFVARTYRILISILHLWPHRNLATISSGDEAAVTCVCVCVCLCMRERTSKAMGDDMRESTSTSEMSIDVMANMGMPYGGGGGHSSGMFTTPHCVCAATVHRMQMGDEVVWQTSHIINTILHSIHKFTLDTQSTQHTHTHIVPASTACSQHLCMVEKQHCYSGCQTGLSSDKHILHTHKHNSLIVYRPRFARQTQTLLAHFLANFLVCAGQRPTFARRVQTVPFESSLLSYAP